MEEGRRQHYDVRCAKSKQRETRRVDTVLWEELVSRRENRSDDGKA